MVNVCGDYVDSYNDVYTLAKELKIGDNYTVVHVMSSHDGHFSGFVDLLVLVC